jgi:hypothetical protein
MARRTGWAVLPLAIGLALLAYGLLDNRIVVFSRLGSQPVAAVLDDDDPAPDPNSLQPEFVSEPAIVQEVARGGVTRDESGRVKKTYEGTQAPKACPT